MKKLLLLLAFPFSLLAQPTKEIKSKAAIAMEFVNTLSYAEKAMAIFPFDELNRYDWHYVPGTMSPRNGMAIKDMSSIQKMQCNKLLQAYLSSEGYKKTESIMSLEYILQVLEPNNAGRIPENYSVAIYGTPNKDSIWGWKFGGHHLALNFTVVKDKIAFAPFFFGANPGEVREGEKKGLRVLREEEDLGFELVNSFSANQKQIALFRLEAFAEIVTTNEKQVKPLEPVGILASDMTKAQKLTLNKLLLAYLVKMPKDIADARMERIVKEEMNDIRFGWAGGTEPGKPHYYRVQGKTFLIEFDNTQNNSNHVHTVWRDFNGDFGADLLMEHYHESHHH